MDKTVWEAVPDRGSPQTLAELRSECLEFGIHIERLAPETFCLVSDGANYYVHAPRGSRGSEIRLIPIGKRVIRPFETEFDRNMPGAIDTLASRAPVSVAVTRRDKHSFDLLLDGIEYRFEKVRRRGPALQLTSDYRQG